MNDDVWKHRAELVRQKIANKKPVLTIKDVMEALGMKSKSTAENAMQNWERLGIVERVETGERKGTWHLV